MHMNSKKLSMSSFKMTGVSHKGPWKVDCMSQSVLTSQRCWPVAEEGLGGEGVVAAPRALCSFLPALFI